MPLPPGLRETGRIQLVQLHLGRLPLLCANIYGYPQGPTHASPAALTDALLAPLSQELILGRSGPRIVAGDFNHNLEDLEQLQLWKSLGWTEAQTLAQSLWGHEPQPTCKHATRRDMIWLSPEAASLVAKVEVRDLFLEHALVKVSLRVEDSLPPTWPQPAAIPWHDVDFESWHASPVPATPSGEDTTQWLQRFMHTFEASLDGHLRSRPGHNLPNVCKGRAKRLEPVSKPFPVVATRPSRPGEEAPSSDLVGAEVTRWFKQLRRLQSLCHSARAAKSSAAAIAYRASLWGSILRAPGFARGFVVWWTHRPVRHVGCPSALPAQAPPLPTLTAIFHDFRDNFRRFEAWHVRQRAACLKDKYEYSREALFKTLREPAREQVDTLVLEKSYTVLSTDPASSQAFLDQPLDVRGSSTWLLFDVPVSVTPVDASTCEISGSVRLCEGDELEQTQTLSSIPDLHEAFVQFWRPKWQNDPGPSLSDWQRILAFASAFLPAFAFRFEDITPDTWVRSLRRMKPRAARGPDGIAKSDLLNMAPSQIAELLHMLHSIEHGSREWPRQWLEGHVISLDKLTGRHGVNDYRPIVLLSVVYRTWAGIRARQALAQFSRFLDCAAYGFLPGREALDFWLHLQADIECSCQTLEPLHGVSTDVVKAFNCLPRLPLFCTAHVLGLPDRLLTPWSSFLNGLQRRFAIKGSVSHPLSSAVGFPEGCPLSTVAMAITDALWHKYLEVLEPRICSHSFVDNLAMTAATPGALLRGLSCTHGFCELLRLRLDPAKTYLWSTDPAARRAFRSGSMQVLLNARDLGGLMAYGKAISVSDLRCRCQALRPTWKALARSSAALGVKLSILPSKCWAKALHGVNGCPASDSIIHDLRTAATQALHLRRAGSSSILRLSLSSPPEADPGFYQCWRVLLDFRRICDKCPVFLQKWRRFMGRYDCQFFQGPFSKLLQIFAQLSWRLLRPPLFEDQEGFTFDLLAMPTNLLRVVAERAWLTHVATAHSHRQTMSDLEGMEPALCRLDQQRLSALDKARLSAIQSGAFLFEAKHSRFDSTKTGLCPVCAVPDTVEHRLCTCSRYAAQHSTCRWALDLWQFLPVCLTHHLLSPTCPLYLELRRYLYGLSVPDGFRAVPVDSSACQHLFTDGSGFSSGFAGLDIAAWAVVHAGSQQALASGPLPGLLQTVPRAELFAVVKAADWLLQTGAAGIIWSDAQHVVEGVVALQEGAAVDVNQDNADLWRSLRDRLSLVKPGQLRIRHTPAHLDEAKCDSPFESWLAQHNAHADTAAVQANRNRTASASDLYFRVVRRFEHQAAIIRALRSVFFHIADALDKPLRPAPLEDDDIDLRPAPAMAVTVVLEEAIPLDWTSALTTLALGLPGDFVTSVWGFVLAQDRGHSSKFAISWLELTAVVDLEMSISFPAICPRTGRWISADALYFAPQGRTLSAKLGLVRKVVQAGLRCFGIQDCVVKNLDLTILGVHRPFDGFVIGIESQAILNARERLRSFCRTRPIRVAADMARPF